MVINALKHGFPAGAEGEILVSYDAQPSGWRLSVSDNGSGPKELGGEAPHAGLGTSIVEALAHQLKAMVEKSSGPGGHVGDNYSSGASVTARTVIRWIAHDEPRPLRVDAVDKVGDLGIAKPKPPGVLQQAE